MTTDAPSPGSTRPQRIARWLLGAALLFAGIGHLTYGRQEFLAQVPPWLPIDPNVVVVASGVVEIALGAAVLLTRGRWRVWVGWALWSTGAWRAWRDARAARAPQYPGEPVERGAQ